MRTAVAASILAIALAGCEHAGVHSSAFVPSRSDAAAAPNASAYAVLYAFKGGTKDGYYPSGSVVGVNGAVYGTTQSGGSNVSSGIVFKVDIATGRETVLYHFKGGNDGVQPQFGLTYFNGELYGTTNDGGMQGPPCNNACGTVFAVSLTGHKRTIVAFNGPNGTTPRGNLSIYKGKLYGTTAGGGCGPNDGFLHGGGTVYSIDASGHHAVLYAFNCAQAEYAPVSPSSGVVPYNGFLYGVTASGGQVCPTQTTCGDFFRVDLKGNYKDLYAFKGASDGKQPYGVMVDNGTFYGTTQFGGDYTNCSYGCGIVFAITPDGKERVVYRFKGDKDGASPRAALIAFDGVLYGTTAYGGASGCTTGCGTLFKVTPAGKETILHTFIGGSDGSTPLAQPAGVGKVLYGTTASFAGSGCCGMVYRLKP